MKLGLDRWLLIAVFLATAVSPLWGGTAAKIDGTVQDAAGNVVPGVTVTVTSPGLGKFHKETQTNKKGKFTMLVVDATQQYRFHFDKEGYPSFDRTLSPKTGANNRELFFFPGGRNAPAPSTPAAPEMGKAGRAFNAGADAMAAGDVATAKMKFAEAEAADPTLVQAPLALAKVHASEDEHAEAAAAAGRALAIAPGNVDALVIRYDAYKAMGDEARTREALDGLLTAAGDQAVAARVFNAGVAADIAGDLDTARTLFEGLLVKNPDLAPAHAALSAVLEGQGDHTAALAASDRALELAPTNITALKVRYEAYKQLGDTAQADAAWQALATNDPDGVIKQLFARGGQMFNAGRMDEARDAYESALKIDPDHAKSHYMLGLCLVNSGDKEGAREHLSRFLELAPDDPDAETARGTLDYLN